MSGPFGLTMGMALAHIDPEAVILATYKYGTEKVPKPHSLFERYILQVTPKLGLSWVKAIGKPIQTSVYGTELMAAFSALEERLTAVYGSSDRTEFLRHDSIWNEPRDWMQSLVNRERFLGTAWSGEHGSTLRDGLSSVYLCVITQDTGTAWLAVEYAFENNAAAEAEIVQAEDDAL